MHLEIIQERLEREYNLDLVTTAPGVIYRVYKTDGSMIELTNPSNLPDPSEIDHMEEPIVTAEIMVTSEFVGAIMGLCQERRGVYLGMEYMEETRALLRYELPLNEIIYDFFDALKITFQRLCILRLRNERISDIKTCKIRHFDQTKKKLMRFLLLYMKIPRMSVDVRCVQN